MKLLSFRFKIALLSAVISGLVLLGFGAATGTCSTAKSLRPLTPNSRAWALGIPVGLPTARNFDRFNTSLQFIFGEEHAGQIILLVKDAQAQTLYVSPGWPEELNRR